MPVAPRPRNAYVAPMPESEGTISFRLNGDTAETWYRIAGELHPGDPSAPAPLVVLHDGLPSLVPATAAASSPDFVAEANRLRADLPPEVEATLKHHEEAGTTDDPAYEEACMVFYKRHLCRLDPWPPEVVEAFAWIERDPTVYHTMNGPSEFHVIGSIKDWQSTDRLGSISVPSLIVSARYDEGTAAPEGGLAAGGSRRA